MRQRHCGPFAAAHPQTSRCSGSGPPRPLAHGPSPCPVSVLQTDFEKDVDLACRSGERLTGESDRWPSPGPTCFLSCSSCVCSFVCPCLAPASHSPQWGRVKSAQTQGTLPRSPDLSGESRALPWAWARPGCAPAARMPPTPSDSLRRQAGSGGLRKPVPELGLCRYRDVRSGGVLSPEEGRLGPPYPVPARSPSCLSPQNPHTLLVSDLTRLVGAGRLGQRGLRPGAAAPHPPPPSLSPACPSLRAHILCCLHRSIVSPALEEGGLNSHVGRTSVGARGKQGRGPATDP